MKHLNNHHIIIRQRKPKIIFVIIGLPQFCFTLELNKHAGLWEVAFCVLIFGIFINWEG